MVKIEVAKEKIEVWKIVEELIPEKSYISAFYTSGVNYQKGSFIYPRKGTWATTQKYVEEKMPHMMIIPNVVGKVPGLYSYSTDAIISMTRDGRLVIVYENEDYTKCYFPLLHKDTYKICKCCIPKGAQYIKADDRYISNKLYVKEIIDFPW